MLSRTIKALSFVALILSDHALASRSFCTLRGDKPQDYVCYKLADLVEQYNPCQNNFDVVGGKASGSTTMWLLGEFHEKHQQSVECLDAITKDIPVHRVYLEGLEAGVEVSCKQQGIPEKIGRTCMGWDDMEKGKEASELLLDDALGYLLTVLEADYTDGVSSDYLDKFVRNLVQTSASRNAKLQQASIQILKAREEGLSYGTLFSNKGTFSQPELTPAQATQLKKINRYRNGFLVNTAETENQVGVVISGKAHLVKKSENGIEDTGAAEYVRDELSKGRHQNTFAILAMRN